MTPEKRPAWADYSKLTDGELNRLVAERQGWREAVLDDTLLLKYRYATPMHRGHRCLVAPNGSVYGVTFKETADSLWAYLFENGPSPATSIDDAAGLDFRDWTLHITRYPDGSVEVDVLYPLRRYGEHAMARAISESWLIMMDAMEAGT